MDLPDAIVRAITEISEAKGLNAMNICRESTKIQWKSDLGSLGNVSYRVPFTEFEKSLEAGMRCVSILIAFSDLITQETNKGMIDNIREANRRGSKTYFCMSSTRKNVMNMYVPVASDKYRYTTLPIAFEETSDGEYSWNIPDSAEIYACVYENDTPPALGSMNTQELSRVISGYAGLEQRASSGVPILEATQSAREYSEDFEYPETVDEMERGRPVVREHGLTGHYPEYFHNRLGRNATGESEYIPENIDG